MKRFKALKAQFEDLEQQYAIWSDPKSKHIAQTCKLRAELCILLAEKSREEKKLKSAIRDYLALHGWSRTKKQLAKEQHAEKILRDFAYDEVSG